MIVFFSAISMVAKLWSGPTTKVKNTDFHYYNKYFEHVVLLNFFEDYNMIFVSNKVYYISGYTLFKENPELQVQYSFESFRDETHI